MKNVSSFFLILIVLLLASCSKEATIFTELNEIPITNDNLYNSTSENSSLAPRNEKTISLQVLNIAKSDLTGQIFVDFGGNDDFTGLKLKSSQHLVFYDENSRTSTLTLKTDNYINSNGVLHVIFAIGANDLRYLELGDTQMIVIQEEIID